MLVRPAVTVRGQPKSGSMPVDHDDYDSARWRAAELLRI